MYYYVRKEGYLGNAFLWWSENNAGYTSDIRKAKKFNKEEAEGKCKDSRFSAYECQYIDNLTESHKLIIDSQYVDTSKKL